MNRAHLLAGCLLVLPIAACTSTVTPDRVKAGEASFDGHDQNSGVIASTATGFVVTGHFRDRYNALVAVYGRDFRPPLAPDMGIVPTDEGHFLVSKECMVHFLTMNAWMRAGLAPAN